MVQTIGVRSIDWPNLTLSLEITDQKAYEISTIIVQMAFTDIVETYVRQNVTCHGHGQSALTFKTPRDLDWGPLFDNTILMVLMFV